MIDYKVGISSYLNSTDNPYRGKGVDLNGYGFSFFNSPSEYIFGMPESNDTVLHVEAKSSSRYCLFPITSDITGFNNFYPGEANDIRANSFNLSAIAPGDMYIGKYGRGYFSSSSIISSEDYRSNLLLWEDGLSELRGYNFRIYSEDSGVEILSESSIPIEYDGEEPPVFGDRLYLRRNTDNGASYLLFNNDGAIRFNIMEKDSKPLSSFAMDSMGGIDAFIKNDRENYNFHLNITPSGDCVLDCNNYAINLVNGINLNGKSLKGIFDDINYNSKNINLEASGDVNSKCSNYKVESSNLILNSSNIKINGPQMGPGGAFISAAYRATLSIVVDGVPYNIPLI